MTYDEFLLALIPTVAIPLPERSVLVLGFALGAAGIAAGASGGECTAYCF